MKRSMLSTPVILRAIFAPVTLVLFRKKRMAGLFALLLLVLIFTGCFRSYFRTHSGRLSDPGKMEALRNPDKFFIIHLKDSVYAIKNLSVNGNLIEAELTSVPQERFKYMNPDSVKLNMYKSIDKSNVLTEVHLYAKNEIAPQSNHITIPFSSVSRIDVYEKDRNATAWSHALGVLTIVSGAVAAAAVIALIIVLITCNCPQVYVYDGNQYEFKSGVFSGAIYSSLKRSDYLPLDNLKPHNGKFIFKVANNQKEDQYIDQLQLINAEYNPGIKVLLDKQGMPHTYGPGIDPGNVVTVNNDLAKSLKYKDGNSYMFNEASDPKSSFGNVIMSFDKPAQAGRGKLIVHAKNTLWSGYIFDEFSALFGIKYQSWTARQDKADGSKIEKWQREQALPLMVYMETDNGWEYVDYFPFTGNTAGRDMIMQINMPSSNTKARIKIESAYMFWELDYVAMDFSADEPVKLNYIDPSVATTGDNSKVTDISTNDQSYVQLKENEALKIEFNERRVTNNKESSYFLLSSGYYHSNKKYTGKTQTAMLYQFRKKGAFNEFSKVKFEQAQQVIAKGMTFPVVEGGK